MSIVYFIDVFSVSSKCRTTLYSTKLIQKKLFLDIYYKVCANCIVATDMNFYEVRILPIIQSI